MNKSIDQASIQSSNLQFRRLHKLVGKYLQGLRFLFFRKGYADEWTLHFGKKQEYPHPKMKGVYRGTVVLSCRSSYWIFTGRDGEQFMDGIPLSSTTSVDEEAINSAVRRNSAIDRVMAVRGRNGNGFGLMLMFTDGSQFVTIPNVDNGNNEEPIEDFVILTPDKVLEVGPGIKIVEREKRQAVQA